MSIKDGNQKVVDLSAVVTESCTRSVAKTVDTNRIEIFYQPGFDREAGLLLETLAHAFELTKMALMPLKVQNVKFFLFHMPTVPENYSMQIRSDNDDFYLHLLPFSSRDALELKCSVTDNLCSDIALTIPHELSHRSVGRIVDRDSRWFDEGLAEFVSIQVSSRLAPEISRHRIRSYLPRESLYRKEIRKKLFQWKPFKLADLEKHTERDLWNEFFYYGAAYRIFEYVADVPANAGSMQKVLSEVFGTKSNSRALVRNKELQRIVLNAAGTDLESMAEIDQDDQLRDLRQAEAEFLSDDSNTEQKFSALYRFAAFHTVPLSRPVISRLIEIALEDDPNAYFAPLAATSLAIRRNDVEVKDLLDKYLRNSQQKPGLSANAAMTRFRKIALRPT